MIEAYKETELGEIPIDWDFVVFSSIAELRHGYQFRNYDFTESGIKILKITQIKGNETIDLSSCSFISEERIDDFRRVIIEKGDILIALTGATIGKIARFNSDELVLQNYRVGNFFPIDENALSKDYLFHYLRSNFFYHQILARQTQSAQQNIGKEEINNMMVFLPKPEEQKAIANILTVFDNKIENLQAQIKTLEQTAQTIFKEWFGKYQLGDDLPDGWTFEKLETIADHIKNNIKPFNHPDKEYLHYSLPAYDDGLKPQIEKGATIKSNKYEVVEKSFLVSKLNPFTPRIWTIFNSKNNHICSTEFQVVKPKTDDFFSLIHCFLNSSQFTAVLSQKIKGTSSSHQRVNPQDIFNVNLIVPSENDLRKFNSMIYPLVKKKDINNIQIQTLKNTRDSLLPKLMSGQIRVKDLKD